MTIQEAIREARKTQTPDERGFFRIARVAQPKHFIYVGQEDSQYFNDDCDSADPRYIKWTPLIEDVLATDWRLWRSDACYIDNDKGRGEEDSK